MGIKIPGIPTVTATDFTDCPASRDKAYKVFYVIRGLFSVVVWMSIYKIN
jgi:hypothetical protein